MNCAPVLWLDNGILTIDDPITKYCAVNSLRLPGERYVAKAGGILALIAGIFGVLAAVFTLFMGGAGSAFQAEGADTVLALGWGGLAFSFIVIILGAVGLGAMSRLPGILLIVSSLAGAALGGTFVALFMVLSLIGGIFMTVGRRQRRLS